MYNFFEVVTDEIIFKPIESFIKMVSFICMIIGIVKYLFFSKYKMDKYPTVPEFEIVPITLENVKNISNQRKENAKKFERDKEKTNRIKINNALRDNLLNDKRKTKIKKEILSDEYRLELENNGYRIKSEKIGKFCIGQAKTGYYIIKTVARELNLV